MQFYTLILEHIYIYYSLVSVNDLMLDTGIDLIFFICNIYNNDLMHI